MSSPVEHHVSDRTTKVQTRSRRSTPTSSTAAEHTDQAVGSRKRKRDGNTMEDLLKDSFIVRPYPANTSSKPRILQPLMLLPRSRLPLSYLDIAGSAKSFSQSRLFEAHVKILELEERMGSQPMVLIARHQETRVLYAVERESQGLCMLCQLGSWVNVQQLRGAAVVSQEDGQKLPAQSEFLLPGTTPAPKAVLESSKFSKRKRLEIELLQSKVKRPSTAHSTESQSTQVELGTEPLNMEEPVQKAPQEDMPLQLTSTDIFDNLRTQYLEALYLSKASLAYFAKGPLSRARAAFHLDYDSTLDLNEHVGFLESLVMSTNLIDKKYRDGVSTCVSLVDIHEGTADEKEHAAGKAKKRKSTKKMKPGKNGLYPTEDTLIRRWWRSHDDDADTGGPGSSRDELTKMRISQLRIRETQLQLIIILEVLALKPLVIPTEDFREELPATLPTIESVAPNDKPAKAKKPDHLIMLIDVHIDRLCIWQSVALETSNTTVGDSQKPSETPDPSTARPRQTDNILRDFCVEVIAPFFSSRLPNRCAIINKKLGGPIVASPPKPKLSKSASFSGSGSRPGAATKRPVPVKETRSLKRVLKDERERRSMSRGPNTGRAISLMRSATMPVGFKREASEAPSLSSIPSADLFQANRGGLPNNKRFSKREVDLSSFGAMKNDKAEKQAQVEAELKEAITALKKPNRQLAGKELAEIAEKRSTSGNGKKSKKPVRNPLFQSVQISATPKTNRQKDFMSQPQFPGSNTDYEDIEAIPPSSLPTIPQSVSRFSQDRASNRNPLFPSIQATPTRKAVPAFSAKRGNDDIGGYFPSSPLHVRRSSAQLFSSVPDSVAKSSETMYSPQGIGETPVKRRAGVIGHAHPPVEIGSDKENGVRRGESLGNREEFGSTTEESIYKSLGWDDVDDLA